MEKQNNSIGKTVLIVLLLVVTIVSLVLATYAWAKYTSTTSSNATAQVAKWNVTFTPENSTFTGTYNHVVTGKVAPGTTGTFDISVVPNDTEVCFKYEITVDKLTFLDKNGNELSDDTVLEAADADTAAIDGVTTDIKVSDLRSHIKLTYGNANTPITIGTTKIEGTYDLGTHNTAPATNSDVTTITWAWAYSEAGDTNYDVVDTAAGRYAAANGLSFKVDYTVVATQVQPE